jgi:catechol 2,3-dioxygenase-like lactoylglutathione lyase family enzyme
MNTPFRKPTRRRFLAWASAAAAVIAGHGCTPAQQPAPESAAPEPAAPGPRILSLELLTAAPLAEMRAFYERSLGLPVVEERPDRLVIDAGATRITFTPAGPDGGQPFYHFAFNIPENKVLAARTWQLERSPLLPVPASLRDPRFPEDVVDYRHWNAHSLFFFDPAGNVVEYIARHYLGNAAPGPFTSRDILYASEIAFVVDDVHATAETLRGVAGVEQYRGGSEQFLALGDERGLLLVMRRGRDLGLASSRRREADVFRTTARVRGTRGMTFRLDGFPYEVAVEG